MQTFTRMNVKNECKANWRPFARPVPPTCHSAKRSSPILVLRSAVASLSELSIRNKKHFKTMTRKIPKWQIILIISSKRRPKLFVSETCWHIQQTIFMATYRMMVLLWINFLRWPISSICTSYCPFPAVLWRECSVSLG